MKELLTIAAEITQHNLFIWIFCIAILVCAVCRAYSMFAQKNIVFSGIRNADEAIKMSDEDADGRQDDKKLHLELLFKKNYHAINDKMKDNDVFRHNWSEFTESLIHGETSDKPIYNSHSASFFFNEDSTILNNYAAATYASSPNFFTGLGILGTFLGLAGGIYLASSGLSGSFDAENTEKLRAALYHLLSGAGLAFITSIVGLVCSLVFSGFEKYNLNVLQTSLSKFVEDLDARVRLVTSEDISRKQLALQEEQRDLMQSFVDHVGQNISDAINGMFSQGMQPLFEKMIEELGAIRSDRATESQQVISELTSNLADKIHASAGKEMEAFSTAFADMRMTLLPLLDEYKETQSKGLDVSKALSATLERFATAQNSLNDCIVSIENSAAAFEHAASQTKDMLKATTEHSISTIERIENYRELIANERKDQDAYFAQHILAVKSHCEEFAAIWAESMKALDLQHAIIKNSHLNMEESWQRYADRFDSIDSALEKTFSSLTEGLASYSASTRDYITSLDDHLSRAATHLYQVVSGLRDVVEEWQEQQAQSALAAEVTSSERQS